MGAARRTVVLGLAGLVGLLVLAGVGIVMLFDPNAHKARLEAAASRATGLEVAVAGRVSLRFAPSLHVVLEDLHLRNGGSDVLRAQQATVGIGLMSLFGRDAQIGTIVLKQPVIAIERDRDGNFNFQRSKTAGQPTPATDWPEVLLSQASFAYAGPRIGKGFEARDCEVAVRNVHHAGGSHASFIGGLSFNADIVCGMARKDELAVADLKVSANAKNGVVVLKPLTARVFGATGSGSVHADYTGRVPAYRVAYTLPQFALDEFFKAMSVKGVASGRLDLAADLSMQGSDLKEMQQTLKGKVSLRGKGLTFNGGDLDQTFARFESSQNFNLFDVGAVFLAGPLGLLVTKGHDFATLSQGGSGASEIRTLVSDWTVERGVARAVDVAMATKENRVALRGGVDWANDRFDDLTLALVDARGCVKVQQKVSGTLQQPVVEKPNLLKSLAGPAVRLLKKGTDLLVGDTCEVFYAGAVAAPKKE